MSEKPHLNSYVLLKDGKMISCSSKQKEALGMAILTAESLFSKRVKLGGRIFTLDEIESDPEKIFKSRQTSIKLDDEKIKETRNIG